MLNNGYIAFAIIEVRGHSAEEISARMGVVTKIAEQNNAVTDAIISGIVVISRGTVPDSDSEKKSDPFSFLMVKIHAELKENVRIAYGSEFADFGKLGADSRFAYSFIAPSFGHALSELVALEFGKIIEVT